MAFDYINEAFKRLDLIEEQMFDTSLNGINELSDFLDNDDTDEIVRVIDPEAVTSEDIQDSYIGKVIVNCNICHSHVFEDKEEIKIEEDGSVNVDVQCPYCGEQSGFTIVGEIAPFGETEVKVDDEEVDIEAPETDNVEIDTEEEVSDDINESISMSRATRRLAEQDANPEEELEESTPLSEDFKEVSITTDDQHMEMTSDENGKVTVTTEPVEASETTDATIVPVSDETQEEILNNNDVAEDEPVEEPTEETVEETPSEEGEMDVEVAEVDEQGMDELGESYLRRVYENVDSFKTSMVAANDKALVVEGVITFASGAKKKTGFIFEAKDINSKGQLRFNGFNKHLSESKDAFSLVGRLDNNKLFVESLKYNYNVNEKPVRGIVRRK